MFRDITVEEAVKLHMNNEISLIDVRSPAEFREASIPGSMNIPIFTDAERAEVGTLYTQASVDQAKERGLEIVSAKLPDFIRSFASIEGKKAVFCWRGGMRSKTTATVLDLMGMKAFRVNGGYRAYRKWVVERLSTTAYQPIAVVLHGHTGCGKTAILHAMKEKGYPVLDFEGMAGHRGSIFGNIGLEARNQKTFDGLLLKEMMTCASAPYMLIEAESARIGKVILPELMIRKKQEGIHLWLELPLSVRVQRIIDDYQPWEHHDQCLEAFRRIKGRIHTPVAKEIDTSMVAGNYERAVELLLIHYYDPRYDNSSEQYNPERQKLIKASTMEDAATLVQQFIDEVFPAPAQASGRPNPGLGTLEVDKKS